MKYCGRTITSHNYFRLSASLICGKTINPRTKIIIQSTFNSDNKLHGDTGLNVTETDTTNVVKKLESMIHHRSIVREEYFLHIPLQFTQEPIRRTLHLPYTPLESTLSEMERFREEVSRADREKNQLLEYRNDSKSNSR